VIITSWPNLTSHAAVCARVLTTPLVCGNQASVTIMILMRRDMLNEDRDSDVNAAAKKA
jgi:phosphohistidine swiveling domain-containing protein